ncbi:hypothetical protein HJ581_0022080 [Rhodococcus opacus]|nr:hypothetical protein HJ581_0022080 [Rhodococcus opacus]
MSGHLADTEGAHQRERAVDACGQLRGDRADPATRDEQQGQRRGFGKAAPADAVRGDRESGHERTDRRAPKGGGRGGAGGGHCGGSGGSAHAEAGEEIGFDSVEFG